MRVLVNTMHINCSIVRFTPLRWGLVGLYHSQLLLQNPLSA
jgi:hypothetical protein